MILEDDFDEVIIYIFLYINMKIEKCFSLKINKHSYLFIKGLQDRLLIRDGIRHSVNNTK